LIAVAKPEPESNTTLPERMRVRNCFVFWVEWLNELLDSSDRGGVPGRLFNSPQAPAEGSGRVQFPCYDIRCAKPALRLLRIQDWYSASTTLHIPSRF
jgi:hypothetical protein